MSIVVTIQDAKGERKLTLPPDAFPLRVGSGAQCAIKLDAPGLSPENAIIERMGVHNYLKALPGLPVKAHGSAVPLTDAVRFDSTEIEVGPYRLRVEF